MAIEKLSPAEAAKYLNINVSTIRRWINIGKLQTNKTQEGWHLIDKEHLLAIASANVKGTQVATNEVAHTPALSNMHETTIKHLSETLERERIRADRLEQRNEQLQQEMLKLTKEMQSILNKETGLLGWIRTKKN